MGEETVNRRRAGRLFSTRLPRGCRAVQYYRRSITMKVTSKGQVTIPQRLRKKYP